MKNERLLALAITITLGCFGIMVVIMIPLFFLLSLVFKI